MSKEELLVSILKSGQSIAELRKSKCNSIGIEEIKNKINVLRNNASHRFEELVKKKQFNKEIRKKKKHYAKKLKTTEEFFKKLEENINRLENHHYHDNDDLHYKGIRQIENLFNKIDEDQYKPIKTKGAFNNNYIEYESRRDKGKRLSVKEYLYMIMPYLEKLINNHKATITDSNDFSGV